MANTKYIEECKKYANKNRLCDVFIGDVVINQSDYLSSVTVDQNCYIDGEIIGSNYSSGVEVKVLNTYDKTMSSGEDITPYFIVKYDDETSDRIKFGTFISEVGEEKQTSNTTNFYGYDKLINANNKYICNLTFPCTIKDFYLDALSKLGLEAENEEFLNSDIPVEGNPFTNGETIRDVLMSIGKVSCTFGVVNRNNKHELRWFSDTIDYEFTKKDYSILEGGNVVYSPINRVLIGDKNIEGDVAYREDTASILENGLNEYFIDEPYFLYSQELRERALVGIWNKLNNFTYIGYELQTFCGKPFLEVGNKIRIHKNDDTYFDSYVMSHVFDYYGSFKSTISAKALTKEQEKHKTSTDEATKVTKIEINKQNQTIQSIASRTYDFTKEIKSSNKVIIQDSQTNGLLELIIRGTIESPKVGTAIVGTSKLNDSTLIIKNDEVKEVNLKIDELLSEEYYKWVYELDEEEKKYRGHAKIYFSSGIVKKDLGYYEIPLKKGKNIIYSKAYEGINYEVKYASINEITDEFTPKLEIISTINQSPEEIEIAANKVSLKGKEIKLTGDNINISSTNFNVDSEGNMKCNNGQFTGTIDLSNSTITDPKMSIIGIASASRTYTTQNYICNDGFRIKCEDFDSDDFIRTGIGEVVYQGDKAPSPFIEVGLNKNIPLCDKLTRINDGIIDCAELNGTRTHISWSGISTPNINAENISAENYNPPSLAELKKNFEAFDKGIETIKNIDIYKYNYKHEDDDRKKHIGLVIGDDYNYSKEVTSINNDSVDLYSMISICVQAIKEQQKQIEQLQKEIKSLKGDD